MNRFTDMKSFLSINLLFLVNLVFSQTSVRVIYNAVMSLDEQNSSSRSKVHRVFVPTEFELKINQDLSVFHYIDRINNEQAGMTFKITLDEDMYIDLSKNSAFQRMEIGKDKFLVQREISHYPWVISRQSETMLGYTVKKASFSNDYESVVAYFAPALPFKHGPYGYFGLPGLIVALDITVETSQGALLKRHFALKSIEILDQPISIKLPKDKLISYEEADRLLDEEFDRIEALQSQGVER
ncbi:GLPGLI family protein [Vaginella massiliensis]|uniref:GLPGLI family protein n=1 Tax=Vaginella massiliensis TaxID=1816680 RepID=UPI0037509D0F